MRELKDQEEIHSMTAAQISCRKSSPSSSKTQPGKTEKKIAWEIEAWP